jgi:putative transcriptional regulator
MVKMKLHVLLAEHNLSQKQISEATGIRQGTISLYASNKFKHIVRTHIDLLCKFFDCTIIDLIEYKRDYD